MEFEALRARAVASAKNYNTLSSGRWAEPESGKGTRQTTGWGLINAKNMVFGSTQSTGYTYGGTFTGSGQGWNTTITLPSDTQYVRMVLVITEPAASSSAPVASVFLLKPSENSDMIPPLDVGGIAASCARGRLARKPCDGRTTPALAPVCLIHRLSDCLITWGEI